ncbi:Asp23/Gls24 family envelope stress response protein [Nocardia rhizosphaerae]|uniref:Asp23/Gls24 family envelope stress response protein n=1 Tax=Nocardia rhizosphaerae TaxID=1691571 RepID=A0ABV8LBN6_9NOCA
MAMTTDDDYLLPCGRDVEQMWERLAEPDAHEQRCPDCRAARESLLTLRGATRALIDEPDPPPPDLFGRIMSAVRADVRRGRALTVDTTEPGSVQVSAEAVAVVLRYAADTVDGVRARGCRVRGVDGDDGTDGLAVSMTVAVRHAAHRIEDLVATVRERVHAAASARIGVRVVRLDIVVADLYEEDT